VETVEQLRFLRSIRCNFAQGNHVAEPLVGDALRGWCDEFEARWPELAGD
jgi:EAL domain-containing protein (putative c-di-GMP-specific phosphodiesterase class I)